MTEWQITAKTIYCEAVEDEVTVLIQKSGEAHCTGCRKYDQPDDLTRALIKEKAHRLKRIIKCEGEDCPRVTGYRNQIMSGK